MECWRNVTRDPCEAISRVPLYCSTGLNKIFFSCIYHKMIYNIDNKVYEKWAFRIFKFAKPSIILQYFRLLFFAFKVTFRNIKSAHSPKIISILLLSNRFNTQFSSWRNVLKRNLEQAYNFIQMKHCFELHIETRCLCLRMTKSDFF